MHVTKYAYVIIVVKGYIHKLYKSDYNVTRSHSFAYARKRLAIATNYKTCSIQNKIGKLISIGCKLTNIGL